MVVAEERTTWSDEIAEFARRCHKEAIPDHVLERAALQVLDTLASAAGAHHGAPVRAARGAALASSGRAGLWFTETRADPLDAILVNGAATRYLDVNDVYLGPEGPSGHPSDHVPVSLAVGEAASCSGREVLASVVVAYELVWRLRREVMRALPDGARWDASSIGGIVGAVITALLLDADHAQLVNAIRLGALRGYTLREVRGGQISMVKAVATAVVAREGVLAARLAMHGMTGPPLVFEGERGLIRTLRGDVSPEMLAAVCAEPEWAILRISVKPRAALGTGQSVLEAAARMATSHRLEAADVTRVRIRIPEGGWTRKQLSIAERQWPNSRESADHCIQFLAAVALLEGDVTPEHLDREMWRDHDVGALMSVTDLLPDAALTTRATDSFPASLEVELRNGAVLQEQVLAAPGSPELPWGARELVDKFVRLDAPGLGRNRIERIAEQVMALPTAQTTASLSDLLCNT